jgi:hypothetical protein
MGKYYPFIKKKALLRKKILQGKMLINKALGLGAKKIFKGREKNNL